MFVSYSPPFATLWLSPPRAFGTFRLRPPEPGLAVATLLVRVSLFSRVCGSVRDMQHTRGFGAKSPSCVLVALSAMQISFIMSCSHSAVLAPGKRCSHYRVLRIEQNKKGTHYGRNTNGQEALRRAKSRAGKKRSIIQCAFQLCQPRKNDQELATHQRTNTKTACGKIAHKTSTRAKMGIQYLQTKNHTSEGNIHTDCKKRHHTQNNSAVLCLIFVINAAPSRHTSARLTALVWHTRECFSLFLPSRTPLFSSSFA